MNSKVGKESSIQTFKFKKVKQKPNESKK